MVVCFVKSDFWCWKPKERLPGVHSPWSLTNAAVVNSRVQQRTSLNTTSKKTKQMHNWCATRITYFAVDGFLSKRSFLHKLDASFLQIFKIQALLKLVIYSHIIHLRPQNPRPFLHLFPPSLHPTSFPRFHRQKFPHRQIGCQGVRHGNAQGALRRKSDRLLGLGVCGHRILSGGRLVGKLQTNKNKG